MAEWLYEAGIGEARAALIADGRIVRARIERDGGWRVGAVLPAKLVERLSPGLTLVETAQGEAVLERTPAGATLGQTLLVEIAREPIPEPGRAKRAKAVPATPGAMASDGPDLRARISATGHPVHMLAPHQPDALEAAGWSELLEEARTGEIAFPGGVLRMSPTPAMTLFDVDGAGDPAVLAVAAARAAAEAIVRHGIGGSIGVDFPTLSSKIERQAAAAALDERLDALDAGPFERTAVNGFGFLQIVRPRRRASLPELLRADPVAAEALAELRRAEREPPPVRSPRRAAPAIARWLTARPAMLEALAKRAGGRIDFVAAGPISPA